mmetsp:Transcript_4290/g.3599  ORF Transcript_4290/g.3599 Transcript_4290/m.3599 type:complete len:193 (+) Transcript_4290:68-646(+)
MKNSIPRAPDFSKREPTEIEISPLVENDIFTRLKDQDTKISSKAAEYLINHYSETLEISSNLSTVINSQASLFCSNNENIKMKAEELIDLCVRNENPNILVRPICSAVTSSNQRSKIMLLEKLNSLLPSVAEQQPVLLSKHVLPMVYSLLDDKSRFIKKKTEEIVLTLYGLIGSALIEFSPSNKLQMILDII